MINPRLIDHFGLPFTQDDVDFAIPRLREDIPLYLDPFLLWASDAPAYQERHHQLTAFFGGLRQLVQAGHEAEALRQLLTCEEPRELGLGYTAGGKGGSAIGPRLAQDALALYRDVPQLAEGDLAHIEEIQLLVPGLGEDRISDLAACILKDFLLEFTAERAVQHGIPTRRFVVPNVYDHERWRWRPRTERDLPYNPLDESPLLFAPLDLLRHLPWINYEDYYRSAYARHVLPPDRAGRRVPKDAVLAYNRAHYAAVQRYVQEKERQAPACRPDPLFEPLQLATLRRRFAELRAIPTGLADENDRKYEEATYDLLASLLYPELEFAASQVRTVSGAHIRDIVFYNDGKTPFLRDLRDRFEARQLVFELKNVKALDREHVNQLHRYLDEEFGHFGLLVTRNPPSRAILRNTVDLHSSKRAVILCLDDSDLELMLALLDSGRRPIEALKKKYIEFTRLLPK